MNADFAAVIHATDEERLDLFLSTSARMGTAVQNVEKDFWVCWTLDALFNGLEPGGPRLLFKGGTSLSKAFGLIPRFSEDIDITVFRGDLGQDIEVEALDGLSGKQRRKRLDAIRDACQAHLHGPLTQQLHAIASKHIGQGRYRLAIDPADPDRQTLLLSYPAVTERIDYMRAAVKIESGAKSALDPHVAASVAPYVAPDVAGLELIVPNVTTVRPPAHLVGQDRDPARPAAVVREARRLEAGRAADLTALPRRVPADAEPEEPGMARRPGARRELRPSRPPVLRQSGPRAGNRAAAYVHAPADTPEAMRWLATIRRWSGWCSASRRRWTKCSKALPGPSASSMRRRADSPHLRFRRSVEG